MHLNDVHNIKYEILPCMYCDIAACQFEDLVKHHSNAHQDQPPIKQCNICGSLRTNLAAHKLMHHGLSKCSICKIFIPTKKLHSHKLAEHAKKCQHCEMTFFSSYILRSHMKQKHINYQDYAKKGTRKCVSCSQVFNDPKLLLRHLKFNHRDIYQDILQRRARRQQEKYFEYKKGEQKRKCWYCPDSFMKKTLWAKHIRTHHSFACKNCPAVFPYKEKLQHVQECSEYGKEYQLVCPYDRCNARFQTYQILQSHIASKHRKQGKERHKCEYCGCILRTRMRLDLHLEYKVCQAERQVMSKSKKQMDGEGGPGTNLELQKVKEDYQSTASESDGEICVD